MQVGRATMGPGRAQMHTGHVQTGPGREQTHVGRVQTGPKSEKTLEGHISLKTCPNRAFEMFLEIYISDRCQKTPQTPDLDKF